MRKCVWVLLTLTGFQFGTTTSSIYINPCVTLEIVWRITVYSNFYNWSFRWWFFWLNINIWALQYQKGGLSGSKDLVLKPFLLNFCPYLHSSKAAHSTHLSVSCSMPEHTTAWWGLFFNKVVLLFEQWGGVIQYDQGVLQNLHPVPVCRNRLKVLQLDRESAPANKSVTFCQKLHIINI